jgi:hypothetical protein
VGRTWGARAGLGGLGVLSLAGYVLAFPRIPGSGLRTLSLYVALFGALFGLYLAATAIALRRAPRDRVVLGLILGFGLAFRVALLPTPIILSSDVYRYLWDGRVQQAGLSPYRYVPADPALAALRDEAVYPSINRPTAPTVYPPGAEALFALVFGLAPDGLLAWRLVLLAAEVATGALLLDLLQRMGRPPTAVVVYAWAPLAVFEGVQAAHVEVLWLPFGLLALRWRQAGRLVGAGLALGAAILIKLVPAVLLLAWWRRGDRRLPAACLTLVAAGYLVYLGGAGPTVVGFLPRYFGSGEDFNIGLRFFLTGWIPIEGAVPREAVRGITMVALGGVLVAVLGRIARRRSDDPEGVFEAARAAAAAYLLLVPTALHAWYAVWIVPLLAVQLSWAWLWFSGAVVLSYLKYAWDDFPFWLRALEFFPLYGLLLWEWWTGAAAIPRTAGVPSPVTPDTRAS